MGASADTGAGVLDAGWRSVKGRAAGLEGISGRIAFKVGAEPAGVFEIDDDGSVAAAEGGDAQAVIDVDSQETLAGLLRGETPPIVAWLQGRLHVEGDAGLAVRVLFGLQAGSPWAAAKPPRAPTQADGNHPPESEHE
jgi:hypothetical protein